MYKHRHVKACESYCVRHGPFVTEIRQRHDNAVYLVTVLLEHLSAQPGLYQRLDRAIVGGADVGNNGLDTRFFQGLKDELPALGCEMVREEAPIADDHAKRDRTCQRREVSVRAGKGRRNTSVVSAY